MRKEYDIVYLTNTPSFYKLNLCNEIAKRGVKVLLVLYGYGAEAVNTQLRDRNQWKFDYEFINRGDSNSRNKLTTFLRLIRLMKSVKTRKVLYAGWMAPEYNLYSFLSPKRKNAMVCESSILDVSLAGLKGWLKRSIINRMSAALPSGKPHKELFDSIGFKGESYITGSVGIINKKDRRPLENCDGALRFIYVGRLIEVKNVSFLVDVFNRNGLPLTVVGSGVLENELKAKANPNIEFMGFIDNEALGEIYSKHNVFILPSFYEPWGLVVEEALFRGLPVIVSDKVGSATDMVSDLGTGVIFKTGDATDLQKAIDIVSENYDFYRNAVKAIDWETREKNQVKAYLKLLS